MVEYGRLSRRSEESRGIAEEQFPRGYRGPNVFLNELWGSFCCASKTMRNVHGGAGDTFFNLVISYFEG